MSGLQQTYHAPASARADLHREDFENLVYEKGRRVTLEKGLVCPCKNKASDAQSNCRNCGGTGWFWINKIETRMVLQAMSIANEYKPWSEEARGVVNITCNEADELTYMDRITALDGDAIFNEVVFFRFKNGKNFAFLSYEPKKMKYAGLYIDVNTKHKRLVEGTDYTIQNNMIILDSSLQVPDVAAEISVTVRYLHAPVFYVLEMKRETMQTYEMLVDEKLKNLPLSGIARRSHYVLSAPNLAGDTLLDNSYVEVNCLTESC